MKEGNKINRYIAEGIEIFSDDDEDDFEENSVKDCN